ncbi:related to sister chromatid cohesion protein [Cephalotrichum gorgonifer]|uniref:Sister chromatid cohesion protein n=1 Tax=Cephalotrichum gorgonifer TaxID=2041049 RepID=A0AAE8MRV8_9PEZI|nr:related to sister chromatid cohesion protein [Cephalotrichum gorgonifer]
MANANPGYQNGLAGNSVRDGTETAAVRPFTFQEALPYSPQTSIMPFVADLMPDPLIGSGTLGAGITDLFNRDEFDAVNRGAEAQPANRKHLKQVADVLLHEIKPKERTDYKFKPIPRMPGAIGVERNPAQGLSPLAKALFDRVSNHFTYPGQDLTGLSSSLLNGRPPSSGKKSISIPKPDASEATPSRAANTPTSSQNRAKIEVAIPLKKPINSHDYMEFDDSPTMPYPEFGGSTTPVTAQSQQQHHQPEYASTVAPSTINPSDLQLIPPVTIIKPLLPPTESAQRSPSDPPKPLESTPIPPPESTPKPPSESTLGQPAKSTPKSPIESSPRTPAEPMQKSGITVDINAPSFNKEEYVEVEDVPDEPKHLSSRRRTQDGLEGDGLLGSGLDQRERGLAALQDLHRLTRDIFGDVGRALSGEPISSQAVVLLQNDDPAMTAPSHQKVQAAIQKTINLGSYQYVPLDHLLRYHKLCEGSLRDTERLELRLDDTWGEPEVTSWVHHIPEIETALKAARTALRIMAGGRPEKQLYSEEIIQNCLDLFKSVMDGIIIPIVELRNSGPSSSLFKLLSPHKKAIAPIFITIQRVFALLTTLVTSIELSDSVVNTLEFSASQLIFVENAHYEKDSAIGTQKFDGLRLVAMDMLCQIFLMKPSQRRGIFDDILTSLEKLPVGKQSARHFKLADGSSIQPVSALIMRLVQASCDKVDEAKERTGAAYGGLDEEVDGDGPKEPTAGKKIYTVRSEEDGCEQFDTSVKELQDTASPLVETAKRNANYVAGFIINRALSSTKSGDTPYRNLLDLFVEDFTTCLDSADWPGAELLLRYMMMRMVQLSEGERTAAPAKNMALDVLGTMGAAISRLRSHVRKTASNFEVSDSDDLGRFLSDLALASLEQRAHVEQVVSWSGPFRVTLEHLVEKCSDDPHLKSSVSFLICEWANKTFVGYESLETDDEERDRELGRLGYRLRMMVEDHRWMSNEYAFKAASANHAKLAYTIILIQSQLFESFSVILNIVLGAMASDQATVRSKSLKSVNQVLETDPAILDGDSIVVQLILQCASDSSPQVRDSALGLIGKCISMRPQLEERLTPRVIDRFMDAGIGPRKRAMKLARDIYLRNKDRATRVDIASGLLLRVQDPDEGVRDLARQMIEEIWFAPFYNSDNTSSFQAALTDHVGLMVQVGKSGHAAPVFDKVLQAILSPQNKLAEGPHSVCKKLVATMFELMDTLDSDDPTVPSGRDSLQVLMTFAKADPKLFTFEQIRLLKPHLSSFSTMEDLHVFRAAVVIYRRVLPLLSAVHTQFFTEVRTQLLATIGKINKVLLDDVMACAWILCGLLDSFTPLARLALSSLVAVQRIRQAPLNEKNLTLFQRYAVIIGMVGKHCDLDSHIEIFKEKFPTWKGKTVTTLMVDFLVPFTAPERPQEARKAGLDAIGLVCQSWPRNYVLPNVYTTFQQVFDEKNAVLEDMVLSSFKEFLLAEERRSEVATQGAAVGAAASDGEKKRELTVMGGTSYDDVASATTQRFLKEVIRIATSSLDDHAFLAVELLGSINRQGLVHPKETGVTFITLETSSNPKIAEVAFQEHRALHEKHETVLEREYSRAIQSAFLYQRDIVKDVRGATVSPFQPKLHLLMEVLKISKSKNRQKFLVKFVNMVDFDPSNLDVRQNPPSHVVFAQFMIENLAFFEYLTVGEVLATVGAMEKMVSGTGAAMAHAIESEMFNVNMDVDSMLGQGQPNEGAEGVPEQPVMKLDVDEKRLRQFASGSAILLSLWEARTYLRRLYGLGTQRRDPKAKAASKDLLKSPVKVQGITGDKLWAETASHTSSLSNQDSMLRTCRAFVNLLNIDQEFKIADEDEEMDGEMSSEEDEADSPIAERGTKRKSGGNVGPGGRRKRPRSSSKPRGRGRPRKVSLDDAEGEIDADWA